MYLLGNESVGKLIKELGSGYPQLEMKYETENNDYFEEKITLKKGCIKYILTLEEGENWADRLLYVGKINQIELVELLNKNINIENVVVKRDVKILTYKNDVNYTFSKYIINSKFYLEDNEDLFAEDILIHEFTYSTEEGSSAANTIVDFVKNSSLKFLYAEDAYGKNKRNFILEVNSLDEFNNYVK